MHFSKVIIHSMENKKHIIHIRKFNSKVIKTGQMSDQPLWMATWPIRSILKALCFYFTPAKSGHSSIPGRLLCVIRVVILIILSLASLLHLFLLFYVGIGLQIFRGFKISAIGMFGVSLALDGIILIISAVYIYKWFTIGSIDQLLVRGHESFLQSLTLSAPKRHICHCFQWLSIVIVLAGFLVPRTLMTIQNVRSVSENVTRERELSAEKNEDVTESIFSVIMSVYKDYFQVIMVSMNNSVCLFRMFPLLFVSATLITTYFLVKSMNVKLKSDLKSATNGRSKLLMDFLQSHIQLCSFLQNLDHIFGTYTTYMMCGGTVIPSLLLYNFFNRQSEFVPFGNVALMLAEGIFVFIWATVPAMLLSEEVEATSAILYEEAALWETYESDVFHITMMITSKLSINSYGITIFGKFVITRALLMTALSMIFTYVSLLMQLE